MANLRIFRLEKIKPDTFCIGGAYFQKHACPFWQELRYVREAVRGMDLWCRVQLTGVVKSRQFTVLQVRNCVRVIYIPLSVM